MSAKKNTTPFRHDRLPDPKKYIRLIQVLYCVRKQRVVCALNTWALDDAPRYIAVSYTWGDYQTNPTEIIINDHSLEVGRNCEYVLRQAFKFAATGYFWIDAICINQNTQEKNEEKNHQVKIMGQIYKTAKEVIVCVGSQADDIITILSFLQRHRRLLKRLSQNEEYDLGEDFDNDTPLAEDERLGLTAKRELRSHEMHKLLAAYRTFLHRPYFSRLWILQELRLARKAWVCCGYIFEPFASLRALDILVQFWAREWKGYRRRLMGYEEELLPAEIDPHDERMKPFILKQRHCLYLACNTTELYPDLIEVLNRFADFECGNPRDRLYGILSLVNWRGRPPPEVDYKKNNLAVGTEIMSHVLRGDYHHDGTAQEWADKVLKLLKITVEDLFMRNAIESRIHRATAYTSRTDQASTRIEPFWSATKIQAHRQRGQHSPPPLWLLPRGPKDDFPTLIDRRGNFFADVNANTRDGDWLLTNPSDSFDAGIIARVADIHKDYITYKFVGVAILPKSCELDDLEVTPDEFHRLSVRWHEEDILVLQCLMRDTRSNRRELLRTRISCSEGSSYAMYHMTPFIH
jgi:hypothetical protein